MRLVYAAVAALALFVAPSFASAVEVAKPAVTKTQGKKGKKGKKAGEEKKEAAAPKK